MMGLGEAAPTDPFQLAAIIRVHVTVAGRAAVVLGRLAYLSPVLLASACVC